VIWSCLHAVKARAARFSFGAKTRAIYDPALPSHWGRELVRGSEGLRWVPNIWNQLLSKVRYPVHSRLQNELEI